MRIAVIAGEGQGRAAQHDDDGGDEAAARRVLDWHEAVLKERAEVRATLARLAPAFGDLRAVLNELDRVLAPR